MPTLPNDTLLTVINLVNRANLDVVSKLPLSHATFHLESSGVAGFFGGESAVRATATVNLVAHRCWFGWYNAPGSYDLARQYSGLEKSHLFDALFPSSDSNAAKTLMVDGRVGPDYIPLHSTTEAVPSTIEHLGSLIFTRAVSQGRRSDPLKTRPRVTFVNLNHILLRDINVLELVHSSSVIVFGIITILVSIGGCIGCILVGDWFCLISIALGMIANGMACVVIGSGKLYLKHTRPAQFHAPGDILLRSGTDIVVLWGNEGEVSPLTRGQFELRFREPPKVMEMEIEEPSSSQPGILQKYLIDVAVILLLAQFLSQLLLIPQGKLFGQLMFIGTLLVSWIYNSYLASRSLDFQTGMLFNRLKLSEKDDVYHHDLMNWTEAVVFACLFFRRNHPLPLELSINHEWIDPENVQKTVKDAEEAQKQAEAAQREATKEDDNAKLAQDRADKAADKADKARVAAADKAKAAAERAKSATADKAKAAAERAKSAMAMDASHYYKAEEAASSSPSSAEERMTTGRDGTRTETKTAAAEAADVAAAAADAAEETKAAERAGEEAKQAKQAADKAIKARMEAAENVSRMENEKEIMKRKKEEDDQKRAKVDACASGAYNPFKRLLNALLQPSLARGRSAGKAFKDSLVRKIGENDVKLGQMPSSFNFGRDDEWEDVNDGQDKVPPEEIPILEKYHTHANAALTTWNAFHATTRFPDLHNNLNP